MMAIILNSAILDSAMLHKTLTQTSSFWLKLIHSDSTWWWQPSWNSAILDSDTAILDSNTLLSSLRFTQKHSSSTLILTQTNSAIWQKNFTDGILTLDDSAILNSAILDSAILHKKKLHLFILTQLDDGSHLEFCHVGFRHCHLGFKHLVIFSQIHSKTLFLYSDFDSN